MDSSLTIHALKLSDADFDSIVRANPEWNFEQTALGELVVVPPTGGTSGNKNSNLSYQLEGWNLASDAGKTFDSNTMFVLPNSAKRMPDASWVRRDRWDALTQQQQDGYPPLCPDFVAELRSPTESLEDLQAKMREYMDNGARLGWLINPQDRTALDLSSRAASTTSARSFNLVWGRRAAWFCVEFAADFCLGDKNGAVELEISSQGNVTSPSITNYGARFCNIAPNCERQEKGRALNSLKSSLF